MGLVGSSCRVYKNVDLKSHPRQTNAHHLLECRMDPFPSEDEHKIEWKVVKMGDCHIRCYITGCKKCDESKVFIEKITGDQNIERIALRRIISDGKTITLKFEGLENLDLQTAVESNTLTSKLLVN
jgi:hypothetical protein